MLPARDRRQALRPVERRGSPRPRFHPGWSPCPAWRHTETRKQPQSCWILLYNTNNSIRMKQQRHKGGKKAPSNDIKNSNSPHVDDVSPTSPVLVVVEDDVTVASVKLSIRGRIHGHFVRSLNTPNLQASKSLNDGRTTKRKKKEVPHHLKASHLLLAAAVVHHAVLGGHG